MPDASIDGSSNDGPAPLTLDIAVTGCATFDAVAVRCTGSAPLALSFSPVGSPEFTRFLWTFGDGTPAASDRAPVHTYTLPGSYEVTLVGVLDAMRGTAKPLFATQIVVEPLTAGAPCDVGAQCGDGLGCACAPGTGCPPAFVRGLCTTACETGYCGPAATCAVLALGPPFDAGAAARLPFCVAACQVDTDCATGLACASLPAGGAANPGTWVRGCVPHGALRDFGDACRNANGNLDDAACATGACADLGALGICGATCDSAHPCPESATCARLADGRRLCLLDCASTAAACTRDPLLTCSPPTTGDAGTTGYQADALPGATYCAPKACSSDADCTPAGRCGSGAVCVRL